MLNNFSDYLAALAEYAETSDSSKLILESLASVYGDLLKFSSVTRQVFVDNEGTRRKLISIRSFLRVQWEPFEAVFGDIERNFNHHLNVISHSAGASQLNTLRRVEKTQNTPAGEREAFLGWISQVDFERTHEDIFATRHLGTGDWLVQTNAFQTWLESMKSKLLWCHGKPGVGKSVLTSNVLEHITTKYALHKDTGVCFAYYNYRIEALGDPCQIISALVKQLCRTRDTISADLLKFKHDSLQPSFASLQDIFVSLAAQFDQIFVVIDALDECPKDKRHQIIGFLTKVLRSIRRAKVFITSRKESDIAEAFQREETPVIEILAENVSEDINVYVCSEVKRLREGYNGKRLYVQSDALEEKIIRTLTEKADGMFLWVNLQLENLRHASESHQDREIESALEKIPQGLYKTYKSILCQIDAQTPYMKALALKSFEWVLYTKQPLRTEELQHALATKETLKSRQDLELDSIDVILKACSNLLLQEHDIIRPIHYSVQEFLTNPPPGALQGSCLATVQVPVLVHKKLALSCIFYLQLEVIFEGPCKNEFNLYSRLWKHPFLWYAARFFDQHVRDLQDISDDVFEVLETFLHQSGLFLATVLQIRKVENPWSYLDIQSNFDEVAYNVDARSILYSTHLYDVALFKPQLVNGELPKFALHNAAVNGSLAAVTRLIEARCSVNEQDENNQAPLYFAALKGYGLIVKRLLAKQADVNVQGGYYGTALQAASAKGHEVVVQLLLKEGADVNAQAGYYGTAFQAASVGRHEAVVKVLKKAALQL